MTDTALKIALPDEDATATLAQEFSRYLAPGDTLLLEGPIGAGKTTFARALIRARLGRMEDVPSPTFTIVQTYEDDRGDIWHCDLYRLTHPDEAWELGLEEAFETAICLIEWPDRLGNTIPKNAILMQFEAGTDGHTVAISGNMGWLDHIGHRND